MTKAAYDKIADGLMEALEYAQGLGLHDCPLYTTETRRLICGCPPGKCQQEEAEADAE